MNLKCMNCWTSSSAFGGSWGGWWGERAGIGSWGKRTTRADSGGGEKLCCHCRRRPVSDTAAADAQCAVLDWSFGPRPVHDWLGRELCIEQWRLQVKCHILINLCCSRAPAADSRGGSDAGGAFGVPALAGRVCDWEARPESCNGPPSRGLYRLKPGVRTLRPREAFEISRLARISHDKAEVAPSRWLANGSADIFVGPLRALARPPTRMSALLWWRLRRAGRNAG